ncbi:6-bladed beta-propeller [Niabella beijingensis]|uniref:6-bladed beta-propeller n=1 Tax=Niabella beijingensis TaxID=2872700 RepID=UPI001CBFECBD|nr:6-bladed beta-propeller [Niabella beijingensis]MBZ4189735.1 6-bladed beta-propeller [Niabella beijingensis]
MRRLLILACLYLCMLPARAQEQALYISPDNALGIKAANLFSEIRFIPLETTAASYFNNMADFLITPDRLIFTDNASNSILVFDKQGKFLHKFKKKKYKLGPLQYDNAKNAVFFTSTNKNYTIPLPKVQQMTQTPGNRDFSRYKNHELMYLDEKENYRIEKLPVPYYALNDLYYMNGRYLLQNNRYNKYVKDTVLYHLDIMSGNEKVIAYFPFLNVPRLPTDFDDVDVNIDRTLNDTTVYIQKNYDNTVYRLVNDSLTPAYRFVFPAANTMPADFYTTAFRNNIDFTSYKSKYGKAVKSFFNIIDLPGVLFFGTNDNSWGYKRYVFSKNSASLYDLSKTTSDSSTCYLPTSIFMKISNYDTGYVYTSISGSDLLKEKAAILARYKDGPPPFLKQLLDTITRFSNPVIIQLKINPAAK